MTTYEPTGGDGRYARIYVRNLEPSPAMIEAESLIATVDATLDEVFARVAELATRLDLVLTSGDKAEAEICIQRIRAAARARPPAAPAESAGAEPA